MTPEKDTDTNQPPDLADSDLAVGDVLRDRRRNQYFKVTTIDKNGIGLRNADTEFFVPISWFAPKYDAQLHPIDEAESIDVPDWV